MLDVLGFVEVAVLLHFFLLDKGLTDLNFI